MKREWTPGDVAMRVSEVGGTKFVALRVAQCPGASLGHLHHWHFICPGISETQCGSDNHYLAEYRPLVVIDPEDRDQVERLTGLIFARMDIYGTGRVEATWAALRSLIEPPKPEEPTGLGAVVEDAEGRRYVRTVWVEPWDCDGRAYEYVDIDAVKVLSAGVTA